MATSSNGVQTVGTDDAPIALGATGGASDIWTWNHNQGKRAAKIDCLRAYDRQNYLLTAVYITQPSENQIVITNTTGNTYNVVMRVTWEDMSQTRCAPLPASVGTLG